MDSVSDWQHPFVDVFKRYNTFEAPRSYKGNVKITNDPIIARKCFQISGSIISNNLITIPDPTSEIKRANLIGRYIYVELFAAPEKLFCIHFEIGIKDREPGVRFTFSNMEKQYSVTGGNTLKIPFQPEGRNLWTIACIDIEHHLENFGLFSKGVIKNYTGVHTLRGIQICSNQNIRGIYTSSNVYDWDSLPKEMSFKMVKGGRWSQHYNFIYLPNSIDPSELKKKMKEESLSGYGQFPNNIVEREETTQKKKKPELQMSSQQFYKSKALQLQTQPLVQLNTVFSFSSLFNPDMLFKQEYVYYSAGSILVRKHIKTGEQLFMQGHTDYIVALDSHEDWIATVQEGSKSGVKIWIDNKCISSFQCPYEKVQQIRLSHKKHLAMVGLDSYKRQAILVFDISDIQISRRPVLLAKQISDFNILSIKFSPTETDKLVSCGKENIRFWRVKNQHLPGAPVILNHHARNTIFTVFDFDYFYDDPNPLKQKSQIRRVYVGSQNGLLFQVNYQTHELEEVYKLHEGAAISSIVVSAGFCVTGSEDQMLKVWNMDFTESILEARNDGVVTSLVLSEDSALVACGTSTGSLSILDLSNNDYKTIVRSHTANVSQIEYHSFSNLMISLSNDLTIRLWNTQTLEQTYEFNYPNTDICTCISGHPNALLFAAGFNSGVLRIFDIENTVLVQEINHHSNPIIHIEYSPDGHFLAVLQQKFNMLYSPLHSHQPIKHLPVQIPSKYKHSCFSEDSEQISLIGDSGTHINIWELRSLQMIGKIFTGKTIKKLKYESDKIWTIFQDTSIRRYNITEMTIETEMQALHRQNLNAIDYNLKDHLLYSVGDDSFLKVWDYSFKRDPHQVNIGHANNINDIKFKNGKLWTVGSEGVFVWECQKPLEQFVVPPVFNKERKANFIKNAHYDPNKNKKEESENVQEDSQHQESTLIKEEMKPKKIMFSNLMKQTAGSEVNEKFVPQKIQMTFQPKLVNLKKIKKREPKAYLTSKATQENQKLGLPLKHFFQEELIPNQLQYTRKIEMMKQNSKKFKLQYLIGVQPYAHDHLVWNFMYGWYAYVYDNLVIVQSLGKVRSQRIITLPQKVGSLELTKDFKRLLCASQFNPAKRERLDLSGSEEGSMASSSDGEGAEKQTAAIYVIGPDLTIERKLEFHPKGVQSIALNANNKYAVSVGNFRECTVCVWQMLSGKLKASSYTLDKLNDIAIMEGNREGRLLEFATVGRDQIHFWAFTKEEKLEYYDVFIQKDESETEVPEITSCNYLNFDGESPYLVCGTTSGELILVKYGSFQVTWRKKICSGQIMNIKCYLNRTVIGSADGCVYFWDYNNRILQTEPSPSFNKINLYYSVNGLYFDLEGNEGIVSTTEGIYYVNLTEQMHSLLVGGSPDKVIFAKIVNNQFLLTSHQNGRLKLWNIDTAEELKTYKWRYPCTEAYYDDSIGKIVCFCKNQSIKLVNVKKFTKQENYLPEELVKLTEPKLDDSIFCLSNVQYGGKYSKWAFSRKGNVYDFQIYLEGKKKIIKMDKVLQLGADLHQIVAYSDKNLLLSISKAGQISAYNVDMNFDQSFSLLLVDKSPYSQFCLEKKNKMEEDAFETPHFVRAVVSKVLNQTYLAISEESQYVYFRNFMKRITFQKISLGSLPTSILLRESKKECEVLIGLREGSIITFNGLDPEHRSRYEGIVNNCIDGLNILKNKNSILATYPTAMAIYSSQ